MVHKWITHTSRYLNKPQDWYLANGWPCPRQVNSELDRGLLAQPDHVDPEVVVLRSGVDGERCSASRLTWIHGMTMSVSACPGNPPWITQKKRPLKPPAGSIEAACYRHPFWPYRCQIPLALYPSLFPRRTVSSGADQPRIGSRTSVPARSL